jgi:hypothetical protein
VTEQQKPTTAAKQTKPQTSGVPTENQVNRFLEVVESVIASRLTARSLPEPPTDPETDRAVLGYQVISQLIGRRQPSAEDSSKVQVERAKDALAINVVTASGKTEPVPENSKVTMYIESTSPTVPEIVTETVGKQGRVKLESRYQDKVIAALVVRVDGRTAVSGRIVPPAQN